MSPLHVALVSEHASPLAALGGEDAGGQNVHVAALATEFGKLGCQVTVYTRRDAVDLPARVPMADGVTVEHVTAGPPRPVLKDQLFGHMPAFAAHLRRRWRAEPPDLAHAHFWMSGWATAAAASAVGTRVPMIQTFHALGVVKARYQGTADTSPAERQAVESALLEQVDQVIATCTDEENELLALGADPERISVVPCGIDPELFTPGGLWFPRGAEGHRIVIVSRLVPRKGVEDAIQALVLLPDTELLVAGGPPGAAFASDPEVRRLQALARRCGVGERVRFLGSLPRDQVPPLMRSADVVVSAPWYEPFGIVPLEAMACGVPVVGTAVGGQLDTVQPERTGLLVEPHDPTGLATAVERLLTNPSLRYRMGEEGKAWVRERFTWDQVAWSTLAVYERVARSTDSEWWAVSA